MIDQETLLSALRTVKDPELNVNVIDLGLVYSIQTRDDQVDVEMTLTSPACPAGPEILRSAATALEAVPGVAKANVRLVMSPPWTPDKMTRRRPGRAGLFLRPRAAGIAACPLRRSPDGSDTPAVARSTPNSGGHPWHWQSDSATFLPTDRGQRGSGIRGMHVPDVATVPREFLQRYRDFSHQRRAFLSQFSAFSNQ